MVNNHSSLPFRSRTYFRPDRPSLPLFLPLPPLDPSIFMRPRSEEDEVKGVSSGSLLDLALIS